MQHASDDEMTPPRSLGRYAPAVRLRRALPAQEWQDKEIALKSRKAGKRMRHCRFSIGSAPLTSIIKSDAQISGGETRQDYKDPRCFPLVAPSCALLFLPYRLPDTFRLSPLREAWRFLIAYADVSRLDVGSSLQAGLFARTPRSVRPLRLIR